MRSDGLFVLLLLSVAPLVLPAIAATSQRTSVSSTDISPRSSLLSHWRRIFPTTTEIPSFLLSRSSPLTAAQLNTFSAYIDAHTLNNPGHLSAFCKAANILCSSNLPHGGFEAILPIDGVVIFRYGRRTYSSSQLNFSHYSQAQLDSGLFFREANITTGRKLHISDIRDKLPKTSFLPKQLSDKLPFSSESLPGLVELLGVSSMQRGMLDTVSTCELPPMSGERKSCVQSIEGMVDFAAATVGQKADVLVTESADGWGQEATVGSVVGRKEATTAACHRSAFPYPVYYCHVLPGVKVYEVEVLIGNGAEQKRNRLVAVCHKDTSKWSAAHLAFAILGSGPGKIEACHFLFEGEIAWIVRD